MSVAVREEKGAPYRPAPRIGVKEVHGRAFKRPFRATVDGAALLKSDGRPKSFVTRENAFSAAYYAALVRMAEGGGAC